MQLVHSGIDGLTWFIVLPSIHTRLEATYLDIYLQQNLAVAWSKVLERDIASVSQSVSFEKENSNGL